MMRTEHPKPQFMRENWQNLNGEWQFEIDQGNSGEERNLFKDEVALKSKINVPFCPESKLSGIEFKDFMNSVWYKRELEITEEQLQGLVFLHFGAVDYRCDVFVNEQKVGSHVGGFVSFKFDITKALKPGKNTLCVHATDDSRSGSIPSGKQSFKFNSFGCLYTRTTGIWQTVWLEFTPKNHIKGFKIATDIEAVTATVTVDLAGSGALKAEAYYKGKLMAETGFECVAGTVTLTLPLLEKHLWEVGHGRLYDLKLTFAEDTVNSYFGLRSLRLCGSKFLINEKSVFQRLVLDQGFYPDGIYTAPSDEALAADIDLSLAMGFNGARLHEKVFEERFLYHADRKGYIVWGEFPNWGLDTGSASGIYNFLPEWLEILERDCNHPSIVGWCPLNETGKGYWQNQISSLIYRATKAVDPSRPCIDASGFYHYETDIMDIHTYQQDPEKLKACIENIFDKDDYSMLSWGGKDYGPEDTSIFKVGEKPFFISEYGGAFWGNEGDGWGYGERLKKETEFLAKLKALNDVQMDNPQIFGLCYTQLTDVEQEQNGLYTYDRKPKFDPKEVYPLFSRKAAIED